MKVVNMSEAREILGVREQKIRGIDFAKKHRLQILNSPKTRGKGSVFLFDEQEVKSRAVEYKEKELKKLTSTSNSTSSPIVFSRSGESQHKKIRTVARSVISLLERLGEPVSESLMQIAERPGKPPFFDAEGVMRNALNRILNILGPTVTSCSGCQSEIEMVLKIAKQAIETRSQA